MRQDGERKRCLIGALAFVLAGGLLFGAMLAANRLERGHCNVTWYGANGKDTESDSLYIQRCLDQASDASGQALTVYIPAGIYYLAEPLEIHSNTVLTLDEGAVMVRAGECRTMLKTAATEEAGYGQQHDIIIQGGTWDGNPYGSYPDTQESTNSTEIIKLRHGENIVLKNINIQNNAGAAHLVEIIGCRNVTIDSCAFDGHRDTGSGEEYYKEAIQLDYCWTDREDGTTSSTGDAFPYDNTVCENITVSNCVFSHYMTGVGQHYNNSGAEGRCRNIMIFGNVFTGMEYAAVRLYTMDDVVISGNQFYGCGTGILVQQSSAAIYGNVFEKSQKWDVQVEKGGESGEKPSKLLMFDNQITGAVSGGIN